MTNLTDATFERAIEVLKSNSSKWGIKASASYYNQVWARDAFISFLGSNMLEDVLLLGTCRKAINTLPKSRSPTFTIPMRSERSLASRGRRTRQAGT